MASEHVAESRPGEKTVSPAREQIRALRLAEGFYDSQILFTLNELGIFEGLSQGGRGIVDIAARIGADHDALARLLNAGVAIGLLELDGDQYANTDLVNAVLVAGRPGYLGNWMRLMSRYAAAWTNLSETVRTGVPAVDSDRFLGGDAEATRDFVLGMDDYARLRGSEIVHHLDLSGGLRVLDLGGGPGTYSILFAEEWPDINVTLFDLPAVAEIAAKNCRVAGVSDRVAVVAGDFTRDPLGTGFDLVFVSDVLHQVAPEAAVVLLTRCFDALRPGGRIVVQGMFLNEDRVSPRWPAIVSLILLVVVGSGRAYTVGETLGLLAQAGFVEGAHQRMSLLDVNSLVIARRPG